MTQERIARRLDKLSRLEPGWLDGEGRTPTPQAVAKARSVALGRPRAGIFPRPDGGLSIEDESVVVIIQPDGLAEIHGMGDARPAPGPGRVRRQRQ